MCPSHFWRVRVESKSQALRSRVESESSKIFSNRVRIESWLGRVESESSHKNCRVTSSHWFASSSKCRITRYFTFFLRHCFAMKWRPKWYPISPDKLDNSAQHAMKWRPICWKMVSSVALACLTADYSYLNFFSLHFTCIFHSQSFQKSSPNLLQVLQPLS